MTSRFLSIKRGFTLLEVILVIVLLGILGSVGGFLIVQPIQAYSDVVRRQQLVDQGEMALRQITRDIRRALPNSIRITSSTDGWTLEMVNTVDGARYRDEIGPDYTQDEHVLDFTAADAEFNLLGRLNTFSSSPDNLLTGHRLVIYNTAPTSIYADAANDNEPGIITPSGTTVTLSERTEGTADMEHHLILSTGFEFAQRSPGQRLFLVNGPISYVCDETTDAITRYIGYDYQEDQATLDTSPDLPGLTGVSSAPLVTQSGDCQISYAAGTSQRGGIITLYMNLTDVEGESISLVHQVHVVNVP